MKPKSNSRLIINPKELDVEVSDFVECDWSDFFPDAQETSPPNDLKI